jgi:hypothetical protein
MLSDLPKQSLGLTSGTSTGVLIDFKVSPQEQDQWCWAAVSSSVANYYNPESGWTQCNVASAELAANCCSDGTGACDRWWYLDRALQPTNSLKQYIASVLDTAKVTIELQGKYPVCIRVEWSNGGGHFLTIKGLHQGSDGNNYAVLSDPIFGESSCPIDDLVAGFYQNSNGRWTHTYLTGV